MSPSLSLLTRQIALPLGIAGIGLGEALGDGQAVAIGFQRLGQFALCLEHIATFL